MDPEEFGGLSDRHILLCRLVGLCALYTPFSHKEDTRLVGLGRLGSQKPNQQRCPRRSCRKGKKESQAVLARDAKGNKGMAGAIDYAQSIVEIVLREAPTTGAESAA